MINEKTKVEKWIFALFDRTHAHVIEVTRKKNPIKKIRNDNFRTPVCTMAIANVQLTSYIEEQKSIKYKIQKAK